MLKCIYKAGSEEMKLYDYYYLEGGVVKC